MGISRFVAVVIAALAGAACAPVTSAPEPQVPALATHAQDSEATPPQEAVETGASIVRPGTPGAVVFFVRGLSKKDTRDVAAVVADALVSDCDPAFDVVVVLEPGLAAMWAGFTKKTEDELKSHRAARARCVDANPNAARDVEDQITLVMDEHGELRRELLEDGDPGEDLVLGAYGPKGRPIYRAGIPKVAGNTGALDVVTAARAALKRAKETRAATASHGRLARANP